MPNIAKVLREEITRISRHEAKVAIAPLRKSAARMRPDVADLKNRLAVIEKELKRINLLAINLASTQPAATVVPEESRAWISGRGVKSLRTKLGLSQGEFGKLTGVSSHAVYLWESKPGMLKLRDATKATIMAVRGIGKVEAGKRLAERVIKKGVSRRRK
jgi:DNA-binding transcriptional regulator YiaG